MSGHDELRELIAAVALGAATRDEESAVERHAATCHDCRAELDASRAAAAQLATEVPQLDPPPELKRRVMAAVRETPRPRRAASAPPSRRRRFAWPALAGALAAIAAGLVGWNITLHGRGDGVREVAVAGTANASEARGRLVIEKDGTATLRIRGLPPLRGDRSYELWTIRAGGTPRSEGFAARTEDGEVVVATADLEGATAMAITPEPRSNTTAPTGAKYVVINLAEVT